MWPSAGPPSGSSRAALWGVKGGEARDATLGIREAESGDGTFRHAGARNDELVLGSVRALWCVEVICCQKHQQPDGEHISHFNQRFAIVDPKVGSKVFQLGKDAVLLSGSCCAM